MLGKCVTNFTLMQLEQLRNVQKVGHFLCWPALYAVGQYISFLY